MVARIDDNSDLSDVRDAFNLGERLHAWVLEYEITHGMMRLAVHRGDYPRCTEIECRDCSFFSDALQGGPYKLELVIEECAGGTEVKILGDSGQLEIRCLHARVVRVRR